MYVLPIKLPVAFLGRTWSAREFNIDVSDTGYGKFTVVWNEESLLGSLLTALLRTRSEIPLITAEASNLGFVYSWKFEDVTVESLATAADRGFLQTVFSAKRISCATTLEVL